MVKFHELGQTTKKAISAVAGGSYQNGVMGTVNASGVFVAGSTPDYILMDVEKGDNAGLKDYTVANGEEVRVYAMAEQGNCEFDVTPENFVYLTSSTYGNISAGTTPFGVNTNGKLVQLSSAPTTGTYFKCTAKINFGGNGITVKKVN